MNYKNLKGTLCAVDANPNRLPTSELPAGGSVGGRTYSGSDRLLGEHDGPKAGFYVPESIRQDSNSHAG